MDLLLKAGWGLICIGIGFGIWDVCKEIARKIYYE